MNIATPFKQDHPMKYLHPNKPLDVTITETETEIVPTRLISLVFQRSSIEL
jgi:hypothetical protein